MDNGIFFFILNFLCELARIFENAKTARKLANQIRDIHSRMVKPNLL